MQNIARFICFSFIGVLLILSSRFASAAEVDVQLFQPSFILIKEGPAGQTPAIDLFIGPEMVALMEDSQQNIDKPSQSYDTLQQAIDIVASEFPGLSGLGIQFISNEALNQLAIGDINLLRNLAIMGV